MFTYCGSNPVSRADPTGHAFSRLDFDYDDLPDDLFPELGGSSGGGAVASGYGIVAWMKHSNNEDIREIYETGEKLTEASSIEEASEAIRDIADKMIVEGITSSNKVKTGIKWIKKGFAYILVPIPTTADDLLGIAMITAGVIYTAYGLTMTLVWGSEHL